MSEQIKADSVKRKNTQKRKINGNLTDFFNMNLDETDSVKTTEIKTGCFPYRVYVQALYFHLHLRRPFLNKIYQIKLKKFNNIPTFYEKGNLKN